MVVRNGKFVLEDIEYLLFDEDEKFDVCYVNDSVDLEKLKIVIRNDIIKNKGGIESEFYWGMFEIISDEYVGILKSVESLISYFVRIRIV